MPQTPVELQSLLDDRGGLGAKLTWFALPGPLTFMRIPIEEARDGD